MKKRILATLGMSIALMTGCTSIPSLDSSSPDYLKTMSFAPAADKAVLYLYRTRLSDHQGVVTSVDIGDVDLEIFPNCVHRFELAAGQYNFEPDGMGTFAIEEEIDITLENGKVHFVELHHQSRVVVPNISKLIVKTQEDFEKVMATDELCVTPIKIVQ